MSKLSRRRFLLTTSTAAAGTFIIHGCSAPQDTAPPETTTTTPPQTTTTTPVAATGDAPETTKAKLGFIALTDSAPLIIAKEKGFFDKYGMTEVEVLKQASWPVTRDNIQLGSGGGGIDGAHILSPMPYMMTLGTITQQPLPMYILARLNVNGQAISLANAYKDLNIGLDSKALKEPLSKAKADGKEVTCAITFPGGTHDLWLRYWLAAGGIDPNQDVSVVPIPPPQMVANMKVGTMEAFCVGEPWNAQLVNQQEGYTALVTGQLWKDHPEKALSMRKDWVDANPKAAKAILMGVMEAQKWCDQPENKEEMCNIVSQDKWFKVPVADILPRSQGTIDFGNGVIEENFPQAMKFWSDYASYPFKSHDLWFLTENIRWGNIPADTDTAALIEEVNREDLWREAAATLEIPETEIPKTSSRGVEEFFDGVKFDPEKPQEYLDGLTIKKA
jgi:nitrate/nitrite transport system substrate-binding protein